MPCEKYQDALIDLAAKGAEPAADVREHLDGCPGCRADLEQEQFLFASINSSFRQTTNAPLPRALVHRFEARLLQGLPAKRKASWLYAAAAALVIATLALWRSPIGLVRTASQPTPQISTAQGALAEPGLVKRLPATPTAISGNHIGQNSQPRIRRDHRSAGNGSAEVLVPPQERVAFAKFVSDLNDHRVVAAALVNPGPEKQNERLQVEALKIAALEIEPPIRVISER
jgi:hypothetical protein